MSKFPKISEKGPRCLVKNSVNESHKQFNLLIKSVIAKKIYRMGRDKTILIGKLELIGKI